MPPRKVSLSDADILGIAKSFDSLSDAVDALQEAVQRNAVDHATIKIKLEDVLGQLRSLAKTVSGDQGLVSRVSVLESRLKTAEAEIDKKAQEIRAELDRDISEVKATLAEMRKAQESRIHTELEEAKNQQTDGRNYRIAVWGAVVSTIAVLVTLALFSLQNCSPKSVSPAKAPAPAAQKAK